MNVFSNVILARNRQLPDDDRMIETCRSIFKSFNVNNLSVCIGLCADQINRYSWRVEYISPYWTARLCPLALPVWCFTVTVDKHTCDKPTTACIVTPCLLFSWSRIFHAGWAANELSLCCRQANRSFCARKVGIARALSPGLMWLGSEVDHSPPSNADVKNMWSYTSFPPRRRGMHKDRFTCMVVILQGEISGVRNYNLQLLH